MKTKSLFVMTIAALIALQVSPATAHKGHKNRISGNYTASFLRFDLVAFRDGAPIFDVLLQGPFVLNDGDEVRTGSVHFPHLLQFPADPENENGDVAGSAVWLFDDGLTCLGGLRGPISADGFRGRGRFHCSDGSKLELKVEDEEVIPGVSATASLSGKFKD